MNMLRNIPIAVFALLLSQSCDTPETQTEKSISSDTPEHVREEKEVVCYSYEGAKDTIHLWMTQEGEVLRGELEYDLFEKDRNQGSISGKRINDLIIADYTFSSEGMESVREVAFKITDAGLVEGYGEVEERGNKMSFKDPKNLRFDDARVLVPVQCPKDINAT